MRDPQIVDKTLILGLELKQSQTRALYIDKVSHRSCSLTAITRAAYPLWHTAPR